jgi:predicted ATPase
MKMTPDSWEVLSDPSELSTLPFPFCSGLIAGERFNINDNYEFQYMGRTRFKELWGKVQDLSKPRFSRFYLYGTIGWGKSYMLAALVCFMVRRGKRVVYLPNCQQMLEHPVEYIKSALMFTFARDEAIQKQVSELKTADDLTDFFCIRHPRPTTVFVVD